MPPSSGGIHWDAKVNTSGMENFAGLHPLGGSSVIISQKIYTVCLPPRSILRRGTVHAGTGDNRLSGKVGGDGAPRPN